MLSKADSPVVGDQNDPILEVESLNAPVYVTIIQRHNKDDEHEEPNYKFEPESYHPTYKSSHSEPVPYSHRSNDKHDSGRSYKPLPDSIYYSDKFSIPKTSLHKDPYEPDHQTDFHSQDEEISYEHSDRPKYEEQEIPRYNKEPHKHSIEYHSEHHINPEQIHLKDHRAKNKQDARAKSFSYLQSSYYTHTPKPKNLGQRKSQAYEPKTSRDQQHHIEKEHEHTSYYEYLPRSNTYKQKFAPETNEPRQIIISKSKDTHYLDDAIGEVKAEFNKGYQTFDHIIYENPTIKVEEKDLYKTTHIHASHQPLKYYEDIKPHIKSFSVETIPLKSKSFHSSLHHSPYPTVQPEPYPVSLYPKYYHIEPETHYKVEPQIHYEVEPEVHYEVIQQYEEPLVSYFEQPQFYHKPRYVHVPSPLPPILDSTYLSHYPSALAYDPSVSKKIKGVSFQDHLSYSSKAKTKSERNIFPSYHNLRTYSSSKEGLPGYRPLIQNKNISLPKSYVLHKQPFPKFAGPDMIKIEIREKFNENFQPSLTYGISPFSVPETEEKSNGGWSETIVKSPDRSRSYNRDQQHLIMPNFKNNDSTIDNVFKMTNFIYMNGKNIMTDSHKYDTYADQNRSTNFTAMRFPGDMQNRTIVGTPLSKTFLDVESNKNITSNRLSDISNEIIFIVMNDKDKSYSPWGNTDRKYVYNQNDENSDTGMTGMTGYNVSKENKETIFPMPTPEKLTGLSSYAHNNSDALTDLDKDNTSFSTTREAIKMETPSPFEKEVTSTIQLSSEASRISFPESSEESSNAFPNRKLIQLLLGTNTDIPDDSIQNKNIFTDLENDEVETFSVLPDAPLKPMTNDTRPVFSFNSIDMLSNDYFTSLSPSVSSTSTPFTNGNAQHKKLQNLGPKRLTNIYPIKMETYKIPLQVKSSDDKMPRTSCQCHLVPKVDPRRKFSNKFINATPIVDRLLKLNNKSE